MKVLGISGGVASGKSTVAREFARLGAVVLDADEIAHRVLDEPEVALALVNRWGPDVLLPDGRIDRAAISRHVFQESAPANPESERAFLEGLVHPRVRRELETQLKRLAEAGAEVVVLDVPLLVEVGWDKQCDAVYFVDTPYHARLERARERGWSPEQFRNREAAQSPVDQKRQAADRILENSGNLAALRRQIDAAWSEIRLD